MKRFFVLLPLAACLLAAHARADHTVTMQLSDEQNSGRAIGSIVITESRYGVVFTPELSGLQPGVYGFHVHEKPSCAPAEKDGKMVPALGAGPHYDPAGRKNMARRGAMATWAICLRWPCLPMAVPSTPCWRLD